MPAVIKLASEKVRPRKLSKLFIKKAKKFNLHGGFLMYVKERVKPFPEWVDITYYFRGGRKTKKPMELSGYRKLAKQHGVLLRSQNGRAVVSLMPGLTEMQYEPKYLQQPAAPTTTENT